MLPTTVGVTTFSQLSSAITSNVEINVADDIVFLAAITIAAANLKIFSSTGAVLVGGGYDRTGEDGGLFHIKDGSDVTFSGLGFASGTATHVQYESGGGGCLFVSGSHVEVEDADFFECNAYVS